MIRTASFFVFFWWVKVSSLTIKASYIVYGGVNFGACYCLDGVKLLLSFSVLFPTLAYIQSVHFLLSRIVHIFDD